MRSKLRFLYQRLGQKLWIRPLTFCLLAIIAAFAAATADRIDAHDLVPNIEHDTIEKLLSIIAASMLGVATFAVGSMVSAYASASSSATPRAFTLVVADDQSKTALSAFIAAFIFSVIALIAIKTGFYARTGLFLVFVMTICILGWVVFMFVRWVDQIARLGRLGTTIDRVEKATEAAIERRRRDPHLGGVAMVEQADYGKPIYVDTVGYVQHINVEALQACAKKFNALITVAALPGTFIAPGKAIAFAEMDGGASADLDTASVEKAFTVGHDRIFEEDPRFGLIVLSEIAGRALSSAVNDPGTAIDIIGTFVRLFVLWVRPLEDGGNDPLYDRVRVPALTLDEMFNDAFTAIARDGAGSIEVVIRLQKSFLSLAATGHEGLRKASLDHSKRSLARATEALNLPQEIQSVRALAEKLQRGNLTGRVAASRL